MKGPTLMIGYEKVPPEQVFDAEGFFRTQDAGFLDAEGRLHWKGRLSHLIKTGGANVSPLELEAALAGLPGVRSVHALGVPHPTLGEAVVLCLVPIGDAPPTAEAVGRWLEGRVAAYKRPRHVLTVPPEAVVYTGSQKVQLSALREWALSALRADRVEIAGAVYGEDGL